MEGFVEGLKQIQQKDRIRSKARYERRRKPTTKRRPRVERVVMKAQPEPTTLSLPQNSSWLAPEEEADDYNWEEYDIEEDDAEDGIPCMMAEARYATAKCVGVVNQHRVSMLLDTGAGCNLVGRRKAEEVGLVEDATASSLPVRGLGGVVILRPTVAVEVNLVDDVTMPLTFLLHDNYDHDFVIGFPTMSQYNITIDPAAGVARQSMVDVPLALPLVPMELPLNELDEYTAEPEVVVDAFLRDLAPCFEGRRAQLKQLLLKYQKAWAKPQGGQCNVRAVQLKVAGAPVRCKARPVSQVLEAEIHAQVDKLASDGLIEKRPGNAWASPIHMVRKPVGWRMCIDYRRVNSQSLPDAYPLPHIRHMLDQIAKSVVFSVIDLQWGFWNVPLTEDSWQYTGFMVPGRGLYVWKVLPFGLKVAPTEFQRTMELAFDDLLSAAKLNVYMDDMVPRGLSVDDHLECLEDMLQRMIEVGLFLRLSKMRLFKTEVVILGQLVTHHQIKPDPKKLQGICAALPPTDKAQLRSFLGSANYLSSFVPDYATVAKPLTDMTSQYVRFVWGEEQSEAFLMLKQLLLDDCALTVPDYTREFWLCCDASEHGVGAVLSQPDDKGEDPRPLAYASRKFNPTEMQWSMPEKELFAIVWSLEHFEAYIKGIKVILFTDHKNHLSLTADQSRGKIKRWAIRLLEFHFEIRHIKGEENCAADYLSRSCPEDGAPEIPTQAMVPLCYVTLLSSEQVDEHLTLLPTLEEIIADAKREPPSIQSQLVWHEGVPLNARNRKIYIPLRWRHRFLFWAHRDRFGGHQGGRRTASRLARSVWWPTIREDCQSFATNCPLCQLTKDYPRPAVQAGRLSCAAPFQIIAVDFIGPRTWKGVKYDIIVIIDHFSRFIVTCAFDTPQCASHGVRAIKSLWVPYFGSPVVVLADRGVFNSREFRTYVVHDLRARLHYTSTEYPEGNGINESSHRILETAIKTHEPVLDETFTDIVAEATLIYNATPNRMTGESPARLLYGQDPIVPGFASFVLREGEMVRQLSLREQRQFDLLQELINDAEDQQQLTQADHRFPFELNDIVTYELNKSERKRHPHHSGCEKYNAKRSLPHRVVKVSETNVTLQPLWRRSEKVSVPVTKCRRIVLPQATRMHRLVHQVYPSPDAIHVAGQTQLPEMIPAATPSPRKGRRPGMSPKRRRHFSFSEAASSSMEARR